MKKLALVFFLITFCMSSFGQITWLKEYGEKVPDKSFKVMQALTSWAALAHGKSESGYYYGQLYLIRHDDKEAPMYDGMIVHVPRKKEARIVGTYQYETRSGAWKTVPIIEFADKNIKRHKKEFRKDD